MTLYIANLVGKRCNWKTRKLQLSSKIIPN